LTSNLNKLLVAMYDPMIARLSEESWEYQRLTSPALCFAAGTEYDLAGTADGSVVALKSDGARVICRLRDPVIALACCDDQIVALGAQGMFGKLALSSEANAPLQWLQSGDVGRPVGFFQAVEAKLLGLFGQTRLGLIDPATEQVIICPRIFHEQIESITFLGAQSWPYAVLTEEGGLVLVDSALRSCQSVQLPQGMIVRGCAGGGIHGMAVVWTRTGQLFKVSSPDKLAECLVESGVLFSFAPSTAVDRLGVLRWEDNQRSVLEMVTI
jgi:hypothetical protein